MTLERIYGGQKINGQSLIFQSPHEFLTLCKTDKKRENRTNMKMCPSTEGVNPPHSSLSRRESENMKHNLLFFSSSPTGELLRIPVIGSVSCWECYCGSRDAVSQVIGFVKSIGILEYYHEKSGKVSQAVPWREWRGLLHHP